MSVSFSNQNKTNVGLQVVATLPRDKSAKYTNDDWRSRRGAALLPSESCAIAYLLALLP